MIKSLLLTASCVLGNGAGALQKNAPAFNQQTIFTEKRTLTTNIADNSIIWTNNPLNDQIGNFDYMGYQSTGLKNYGSWVSYQKENNSFGNIGSIEREYFYMSRTGVTINNNRIVYVATNINIIKITPWKQWTNQTISWSYGAGTQVFQELRDNLPTTITGYVYISNDPIYENINIEHTNPWLTYEVESKTALANKTVANQFEANQEYTNNQITGTINNTVTAYGTSTFDNNNIRVNTELTLPFTYNRYYIITKTEFTASELNNHQYTDYDDIDTYNQTVLWRFKKPYQNGGSCEYGTLTPPTIDHYDYVDIPDLMFTILTLPFTFVSKAFDLTLFPGTNYQVNIAGLLFALLGALLIIFIVKKLKP